jgi:hypothetical protein
VSIGVKVKLHPSAFLLSAGEFESIGAFWGIDKEVTGEVTAIAQPPYQPHPIVHWEKVRKDCFQDVSWDPSNLIPA